MTNVKLDKEVLSATQVSLDTVAGKLPDLLSRADTLGVGYAVSGLRSAESWAQQTSTDLSARVGLIERIERQETDFGGYKLSPEMIVQMAGAGMSVSDQMVAISQAELAKLKGGDESVWSWDNEEKFSTWLEGVTAKALSELPGLAGKDAMIEAGLHGLNEFTSLVGRGAAASAALAALLKTGGGQLAHWMATKQLIDPVTTRLVASGPRGTAIANMLASTLDFANENYIRGKTQWMRPGAWKLNVTSKAIMGISPHVADFDAWLAAARSKVKPFGAPGEQTLLAKWLSNGKTGALADAIATALKGSTGQKVASALTQGANFVFGKPWTGIVNGVEVTYARNAGNLITMARASSLSTALKSAGFLRGLGVVGGGIATIDSVVGVVNNWDQMDENWNSGAQGKAKVIGDFAEVGFNASLTAAMVAPNPFTLGAVAVTGLVYGGARLVEHWDDVTGALSDAADWTGDRLDDVGDMAGDAIDAVKESPLNPGNWF